MGDTVRLQRYIALCGAASRRHAEQMITDGRISVDGKIVTELGTKVEIGANRVFLDGEELKVINKKYYIMLNKPTGYICAVTDQFQRPTVIDLVKGEINANVHPVGRLDYDTEGLLLLTNDGDFTYAVTHPKHNIGKTYVATLKGDITVKQLKELRSGVIIDDYKTRPADVELLEGYPGYSRVKITIHEGKNRQVRKMFEAVGLFVSELKRISIGDVQLGSLPLGRWRHLTSVEVSYLMKKQN